MLVQSSARKVDSGYSEGEYIVILVKIEARSSWL